MQLPQGKRPRYPGPSRHPDGELTILPKPLALAILNTLALSSAVVCQEGQTLDPETVGGIVEAFAETPRPSRFVVASRRLSDRLNGAVFWTLAWDRERNQPTARTFREAVDLLEPLLDRLPSRTRVSDAAEVIETPFVVVERTIEPPGSVRRISTSGMDLHVNHNMGRSLEIQDPRSRVTLRHGFLTGLVPSRIEPLVQWQWTQIGDEDDLKLFRLRRDESESVGFWCQSGDLPLPTLYGFVDADRRGGSLYFLDVERTEAGRVEVRQVLNLIVDRQGVRVTWTRIIERPGPWSTADLRVELAMPFGLDDMRAPSMHRTVTGSRDLPDEFLPWVQDIGIWLDDPDATQRQLAAHSIGTVRDFTAIASLVLATWDSDPSVAGEAITALGLIGPLAREAIPTLEILTEHEDRQIVERAKAALKQIAQDR